MAGWGGGHGVSGADLGRGLAVAGVPRTGLEVLGRRQWWLQSTAWPQCPASQPAQGLAQCWQGEALATIGLFSLQLAGDRSFSSCWRFIGGPERVVVRRPGPTDGASQLFTQH